MQKITKIEGIGNIYAERLHRCGIDFQEQLLERCAQPNDRKQVAEAAGISNQLILKWVNQADLARIHGIGEEYAELLERVGVDTVPELAQRNSENLSLKMEAANDKLHLVRQLPTRQLIQRWIEEARHLPRVINY